MAIPGLNSGLDVRAKVRIGEKRKSRSGKDIPASVDYFLCPDAEFQSVVGEHAKTLRIFFPYQDLTENFSTGLEWWRGKQLTCYTKGEGTPPLAYRVEDMVKEGDVIRGEKMGNNRLPITCPVRDCEFLKNKSCKPMGRLQFFIDGIDRTGGVFQIDTKAWNSIENIEKVLKLYPDPRGVPFILRVEFTAKGTSRFPELYLEAEDMEINNDNDVTKADALVQLRKALDTGAAEDSLRGLLAASLDTTNPGWRDEQKFIDRIKEVGVTEAATRLLDHHGV